MEEDRTHVIETPPAEREVRHEVTEPAPRQRVSEVQTTSTAPRHDFDRVDAVAYDPYEGRRLAGYRLTQLIYWVFGLVEGLIAVRVILKALGANQTAGFAQFI